MSKERDLIERFYGLVTTRRPTPTKVVKELKEDFQNTPVKDKSKLFLKVGLKVLAIFEQMTKNGDTRVNITLSNSKDREEIKDYLSCGTEPEIEIPAELKKFEDSKKTKSKKKVNATVKKIAKNKKNIPKSSTNVTKKATSVTKKKTSVTKPKKNGQTALFGLTPFSELKEEAPAPRFKIGGDIGKLLGNVEIKPIHSVVATLDAPQGAGKTRFLMQVANELAKNYTVLFVSLEEHPSSDLFKQKVNQYLTADTKKRFYPLGELENGYYSLQDIAKGFDVIMIDSWGKATQGQNIDMDKALRKFYNGKLIFPIYQRTQDGKMRGGSEAQFDGDIILKIEKKEDFKENFVYADKNRYQNNLEDVHYNIYKQKIVK